MTQLRIDPLNVDGTFDTDFYGSDNYKEIRNKLEKYIKDEGFIDKPDTYFLMMFEHYWQVVVNKDPNIII